MSTFFAKKEEQKPRWYVIDASNQVLGKVAVKAANVLRGKIKPTFTRMLTRAISSWSSMRKRSCLPGKKETAKTYMTYSQYPGKEKYGGPSNRFARVTRRSLSSMRSRA